MKHQLTGNSGLYHAAHELSRRGWNVMLTARNSKGADLYAANQDETTAHPIQCKASAKIDNISLGSDLGKLRSPWWVIITNSNSDKPTCYVLALDDVKKEGNWKLYAGNYWLQSKGYAKPEHREAWDRLGDPASSQIVAETEVTPAEQIGD